MGQNRLGLASTDLSGYRQIAGTDARRFICNQVHFTATNFLHLEPDPEAAATDAFLRPWTGFLGYAHPPWCLIGRVLAKAQQERATLVLVTYTFEY